MNFKNQLKPVMAGALLSALLALPASGQFSGASLIMTNYIPSGQALTSYPTNAMGTNGICALATGGPVDIRGYRSIGFSLQGFYVGTNAAAEAVGIVLVTSTAGAGGGTTPQVTVGTNAFSPTVNKILKNDYCTVGAGVISFTVPLTAGTNWINFQTNFAATLMPADANWIGAFQVTNSFTAGDFMTNVVATINRKVIPVSLTSGL